MGIDRAERAPEAAQPEDLAGATVLELRRRFAALGVKAPRTILLLGCGAGAASPQFKGAFQKAEVVCLDILSHGLRAEAGGRPGMADFGLSDGGEIPIAHASIDLIFSAFVFHRLDGGEHERIFRFLARVLAPGGVMATFEHNPFSPMSQRLVTPLGETVRLVPAATLAARQRKSGFSDVDVAYTAFFPAPLRRLRPIEPWLGRLPLGAHYYSLARH